MYSLTGGIFADPLQANRDLLSNRLTNKDLHSLLATEMTRKGDEGDNEAPGFNSHPCCCSYNSLSRSRGDGVHLATSESLAWEWLRGQTITSFYSRPVLT
jgi:hypothetical protein